MGIGRQKNMRGLKLNFYFEVILLALAFGMSTSAYAGDCSVSKKFQVRQPQSLAGVFEDPARATLPGIRVELLSGRTVARKIRTDDEGRYDFGLIDAGKYRVRIRYAGGAFCSPSVHCEANGCSLGRSLKVSSKDAVEVE